MPAPAVRAPAPVRTAVSPFRAFGEPGDLVGVDSQDKRRGIGGDQFDVAFLDEIGDNGVSHEERELLVLPRLVATGGDNEAQACAALEADTN